MDLSVWLLTSFSKYYVMIGQHKCTVGLLNKIPLKCQRISVVLTVKVLVLPT